MGNAMRMRLLLSGLLLCIATSAPATGIGLKQMEVAPRSKSALPLGFTGRVKKVKGFIGDVIYVHQWPGVYFETIFTGKSLFIGFDDGTNEYRLTVDDDEPLSIKPARRSWFTVTGLTNKRHTVRLEKVTESISSPSAFLGFYGLTKTAALPSTRRSRQIEFIGDSSMTGYGDRSTSRQCSKLEAQSTTDTQRAYPALVAKAAGADYQVNAISGRGLIRNYDGSLPGQAISDIYQRIFFEGMDDYDFVGWKPQITVIKLNADFFPPPHKGERWKNFDELSAAYVRRFASFVAELGKRTPSTTLLIWWPDPALIPDKALSKMASDGREAISSAAASVGIQRVEFIVPPNLPFESTGCDYHYNLEDHRKMANWLSTYLGHHPEFWNGK